MPSPTVFFRCPYCPKGRRAIALDTDACFDARKEDPDEVNLDNHHFREGQNLIIFGYPRPRHRPCKHVFILDGRVDWRRAWREDEDRYSDEPPEGSVWRLNFDWSSDRLLEPDCRHTATLRNDYPTLGVGIQSFMPRVAFEWKPFSIRWDDTPVWLAHLPGAATYELSAQVLVAHDPEQFIAELKEKAHEYNAFLKRIRRSQ